jgi:hypothetical protein
MTSSYNRTPFNDSSDDVQLTSLQEQELLFQDKETLNNLKDEDGNPIVPSYVKGSKIWFWDKNEEQWVLQHAVVLGDETIKQGPQGEIGKSAYQSYLDTTEDPFPLSEADWVESLKGTDGIDGLDGEDGTNGIDGENGDAGQGIQGPKGDTGDSICSAVDLPPTSGERGKLWIDGVNQIYVTLG